MPFGLIFGALVFGVFCGSAGLRLLAHPEMATKLSGLFLVLLGGALALGLLMRRGWARWAGAGAGVLFAVFALRRVLTDGEAFDFAVLFASVLTAGLLLVPSTGDPRRGRRDTAASTTIGPVGWTALLSFTGLLAMVWLSESGATAKGPKQANALPASAIGRSINWSDFDSGMARARAEGKPVLATFVTDWCPYCSKMGKQTWRAAEVAERMADFVPVRVDAEKSGAQVAARYGVGGYPAQFLLDADGSVISRFDGYQSPRELLSWIDGALAGRH